MSGDNVRSQSKLTKVFQEYVTGFSNIYKTYVLLRTGCSDASNSFTTTRWRAATTAGQKHAPFAVNSSQILSTFAL